MLKLAAVSAMLLVVPTLVSAQPLARGAQMEVEMHRATAEGPGESIGTVRIARHSDGVLFEPELEGLEPGLHGFHLHEIPSCEPKEKDGEMTPAGAAGGHFDPGSAGSHQGPYEDGHKGDLPALYVTKDGSATHSVLAPRLEFDEVRERALMIHQGGDNYSDSPEKLGGGGPRVACGVISPE